MTVHKDPAIVCCRTISMIMIVLCHVIDKYTFIPGHDFLGQVLNVGVFSFLVISGYLYGGKTITDFRSWFYQRYIAICLPTVLVSFGAIVFTTCVGEKLDRFSVATYLFNLQGLGFLVPGFYRYFTEMEVLGPLWFITVIMLCYCMIPLLQKLRSLPSLCGKTFLIVLAAFLMCFGILLLTGIQTVYFLTFIIGYYLAAYPREKCVGISSLTVASVLMIAAQVLRLVLRSLWDGTAPYQNYTVFSHMILGLWIFLFCMTCGYYCPRCIHTIANSKIVLAINNHAFYVFLTHYCYCRGKLNFYQLTDSLLISTLGFVGATVITAVILKRITNYIQQTLKKL